MDQWNEATWLNHANQPTLRAVSGRSLRVLRRHDDADLSPVLPPEIEPDGIRVLVVGDDVLARRGVLAALDDQPGMIVVGDRGPGPEVAAAVRSGDPDVLLLHGLSGDAAAPTLAAAREASRTVRVLGIGARIDSSTMDPLGEICGLLPACAPPEEVVAAVRMAAAGYLLRRTPDGLAPSDGRTVAMARGLTEREYDVLSLVAKGMSNAEIATALTLSEHTVKSHVQNLLGKLRLRNRIHAVIYAFNAGIAQPNQS